MKWDAHQIPNASRWCTLGCIHKNVPPTPFVWIPKSLPAAVIVLPSWYICIENICGCSWISRFIYSTQVSVSVSRSAIFCISGQILNRMRQRWQTMLLKEAKLMVPSLCAYLLLLLCFFFLGLNYCYRMISKYISLFGRCLFIALTMDSILILFTYCFWRPSNMIIYDCDKNETR